MNVNNKITLMIYGLGALAGVLSGLTGANTAIGLFVGLAIYFISPKIITTVIKELPDDLNEDKLILRRGFWGFLLFWFYFWVLTYNIMGHFEPNFYAPERALLYKFLYNTTG
ncbi:hypothetical protein PAP_10250 [Palaeococcus pacificus DY20341]|uniref:Uncharacterized protein n=1 Tax=Palaeococcus pacificus DY20341 TaxID=1343739 RepID=A0A075LW35_9EURY|nr:hypothetical protein [Palaeococcus pacificus]AIF70421.1 hypothetical protein PAP_10250 [Palaeococcus pacificus DY20341]